ncbi:MAG: prepilin-type N-terminal cleavage/methylation domain-containing protein, partial [Candidatus Azambacteria bacterium]|nr:prepilin-type N-terminal cleavage/methylation domain-containing protein [Candidatus Azambacteria bacterium]
MLKNKKLKQGGFTLLELLVVISIIGLLASILVVNLTSARRRARDVKRVADVRNLQIAVED